MYSSDTIKIIVDKPFKEERTPCPPKGTEGELYDIKGDFYCVRFEKPMVDTEGAIWPKSDPEGSEKEYIFLKFKEDEIREKVI